MVLIKQCSLAAFFVLVSANSFANDKISEIYKNRFFACVLCVIYAAASWGIALFGF